MSEIKVKRARQSNWSSLETTIFIDLCKTHKVLEKMDGKRFRWADVLAPIALEMSKHEHNFQRDTSQLMIKLKSLQNYTEKHWLTTIRAEIHRVILCSSVKWKTFVDLDPEMSFRWCLELKKIMMKKVYNPRYNQVGFFYHLQLKHKLTKKNILANEFDEGAGPSHAVEDSPTQDLDEAIETLDETICENAHETPAKKKRTGRSYGAALMDFSKDFMERFSETNKEFFDSQKQLQLQQQEFDKKQMEEERKFFKELFENI